MQRFVAAHRITGRVAVAPALARLPWPDDMALDIGTTDGQALLAVSHARAGIAETGSLILWPDADEPRLMSLVPPLHIALLQADSIYETFAQAMHLQRWADGMPTNALLISGPSKTADIEQTLAYGIHGPRRLLVLILG